MLKNAGNYLGLERIRHLAKEYYDLGQWTTALFWADAAVAASSVEGSSVEVHGNDVCLLANTLMARGELHRAAHAITSRKLHQKHLTCASTAARALLAAQEPAATLAMLAECEPGLLVPRSSCHNRALSGIFICRARALLVQERREAAAEALKTALRIDPGCYEALDLLLEHHALTPAQERELVHSLPLSSGPLSLPYTETALLRTAYRDRVHRYAPVAPSPPSAIMSSLIDDDDTVDVIQVRQRCADAAAARARRLTLRGDWAAAIRELDLIDPWFCADIRAACLLELRKVSELFAFAHTLVDAYPHTWTAWFAVGCYYYLIGKCEMTRRYLSKARSLEPSAGCVWLAFGHSFSADNEHDQAMAAYFKASQLMPGCHLPLLYVGVESAILNNNEMARSFLIRAARLHREPDTDVDISLGSEDEDGGWEAVAKWTRDAHVAHEAGAAAFSANDYSSAEVLFNRAIQLAKEVKGRAGDESNIDVRWATTLDALGHVCRKLERPKEALFWHERAISVRPAWPATYAAMGLAYALLGREMDAADALHSALAKDPDNAVALALLDTVIEHLDDDLLSTEEIPVYPFPEKMEVLSTPASTRMGEATNASDMSMSFD